MSDSLAPSAAHPHLASDFFVWLWYTSEKEGGTFTMEDGSSAIVWVDARLAFRAPDEDRPRAVLTGENPAATLEARAALAGGKVVRDVRIGVKRDDRESSLTLRGAHIDIQGAKLPQEVRSGEDEMLYERMFLVEDVWYVLGQLYRRFARERTASAWERDAVPAIRAWAVGDDQD